MNAFWISTNQYARLVSVLLASVESISRQDYELLCGMVELARDRAERARENLILHQEHHGC